MTTGEPSFDNTEIAFRSRSNGDLRKAELLFRTFNFPWLVKNGPGMAAKAVDFGFKGLIKSTIFSHFCGGETIAECKPTIARLWNHKVGTILDYSVEGEEQESVFEATCNEIIRTIREADGNEAIPFSVFKTTGIARFALLEKVQQGAELSAAEKAEWEKVRERFIRICQAAYEHQVRLFVDAEETWIQEPIDRLAEEMMRRFNTERAIVYNTLQMYRHDRLAYLQRMLSETGFYQGYKLVRGAYMEKERQRASDLGYTDPIQPDKAASDRDYDAALELCVAHIDRISICAGTHNENSSLKLVGLMRAAGLKPDDARIYFSQLLGMSDHISFNLADAGYRVAKYVPYGPVKAVLPYLGRRAQENSGMSGQMGRELRLIRQEIQRRR